MAEAEQHQEQAGPMFVEATRAGFYGNVRRKPGDTFVIDSPDDFSKRWMAAVEPSGEDEYMRRVETLRALRKQEEDAIKKMRDQNRRAVENKPDWNTLNRPTRAGQGYPKEKYDAEGHAKMLGLEPQEEAAPEGNGQAKASGVPPTRVHEPKPQGAGAGKPQNKKDKQAAGKK